MQDNTDSPTQTQAERRDSTSPTDETLYVCQWTAPSGKTGHGSPTTYAAAQALARYGNRKDPGKQRDIVHSVRPA